MLHQIAAPFRLTPSGETARLYAADLARLLSLSPPDSLSVSDEPRWVVDPPRETLFVADQLESVCRRAHVLLPFDERSVFGRGKGGILLPFSDGSSGPDAFPLALHLAKQLGVPLIAYHTTWPEDGETSAQAEDHMCEGARCVQSDIARAVAADGGAVELRFVIELAEEVVAGIVRAALVNHASMIVMARGGKTLVGCYVDRTLQQSPVPALAVADPLEGGSDD